MEEQLCNLGDYGFIDARGRVVTDPALAERYAPAEPEAITVRRPPVEGAGAASSRS